jgi:demethylmenaquinone methyltransferase / 2-methoxy-6-polyprenyl-1,4-benzoquinol methylase
MNEDAVSYLKDWFNRMAPGYDRLEFLLRNVRPQVVEMAAAPRGSRVLDAATGTGSQAMAFAGAGCEVTGIDLSEEMVRIALSKDGRGKATFLNADASDMPFKDGSFDVSVISFALHDMPGPMREAALGELVRVTAPGGTVMVVDYEIPQDFVHRLFIRYMMARHENVYVPSYFDYDLEGALKGLGTNIEEKRLVLRGVGKVLKCHKPQSL